MSINYASKGKLVDFSSEIVDCDAANVLNTENVSSLWLSEEGIPQWLCISFAELSLVNPNLTIQTIGWYCWHAYTTNPREVTVHVSSDGSKFKVWDVLVCDDINSLMNLYCCAPINITIYPYIAFEIAKTWGSNKTYMNCVYLYSDEISSASPTRFETNTIFSTSPLDENSNPINIDTIDIGNDNYSHYLSESNTSFQNHDDNSNELSIMIQKLNKLIVLKLTTEKEIELLKKNIII